jgi:anaphase-promoting complex subunit 6
VYNELAVVYFHRESYNEAQQYLTFALSCCASDSVISANSNIYETILLNLAHCQRKMKDFTAAIQTYEKCLTINPKCAETYVALGYTHHLRFDLKTALDYYHKAHFLKNNDATIDMLVESAMKDINETETFPLEHTYLKEEPARFQ